jgi:hypothetical protein
MPLAGQTACPDPTRLTAGIDGPLAHVRYLADDALEGRAVGSEGARCAAGYIAAWFEDLGLEPAGEYGSYYHTFTIRKGSELGEGNTLTVDGRSLSVGTDWTPLGFSASAAVEAELVFAGTGLSSPGTAEDRFTRVDVTEKIMVVSWGDPDDPSGRSLRSSPHFKATVAAGRDAAAILVLMPEGMGLPGMENEIRGSLAIPVGVVGGDAAAAVRAAAEEGAKATLQAEVVPTTTEARNVLALLPGSDARLHEQIVVVGAHFDHLGYGGESSLSPDERAVHNGADDNASGTAGMMEIARMLAEGPRPRRSVLFMGFTGEERGLWGAARFLEDPTVPVDSMVAMLNLDMVGRLETGGLVISGVGTAEQWPDLIAEANAASPDPLTYGTTPDGYGASDHAAFYEAGIPVLHLFTNTHEDYHRPSDDWEKIDAAGLQRTAELTAEIASRVAGARGETAVAMTPIIQARPSPASGQAARSGERSAGLGVIPDMTPREYGLRITGVREGGAADGAGLQAGDVIVEFGGKEITDIYGYMYALQEHEPGDEVTLVVERDGERLTMTAVLQGR